MICKILSCGVCDIKCLFLIYLLSIIFLMLHYLVFKVQFKEYVLFFAELPFFFLGSPGKAVGFFGEKEEQGGGFTNSRIADLFFSRLCSDVVEMRRIELLTPCLQGRCSPS